MNKYDKNYILILLKIILNINFNLSRRDNRLIISKLAFYFFLFFFYFFFHIKFNKSENVNFERINRLSISSSLGNKLKLMYKIIFYKINQ